MKTKSATLIILLLILVQSASVGQSFLNSRVKNTKGIQSSILKESGDSQIIVLDFWATWCKPCIKSIPKLITLNEEFNKLGVAFIGVNEDSPRNLAKVRPFVNTHKIKYPVLLDTDQEIMNELLVNAFPTLIIINRKGKILYRHNGFANGDEKLIHAKISELLKQ